MSFTLTHVMAGSARLGRVCRSPRKPPAVGFSPALQGNVFAFHLNPVLPWGQWKFYGIQKMQAGPTVRTRVCVCVC